MKLKYKKIENIETLFDKDYLEKYYELHIKECFEVVKNFIDYCFQRIVEKKHIYLDRNKQFLGFVGFNDLSVGDVFGSQSIDSKLHILGYTNTINGVFYTIQINKNFLKGGKFSFDVMIDTVAHELGHVFQGFIRGSTLCRSSSHSSGILSDEHDSLTKENLEIIKSSHYYNQFRDWWNENITK